MELILLSDKFVSDRRYMHDLIAKIQSDKVVRWCPDGELFGDFFASCITASRLKHIPDLHSKFAQGHIMCGSIVSYRPTSNMRRLRIGEEKRRKN